MVGPTDASADAQNGPDDVPTTEPGPSMESPLEEPALVAEAADPTARLSVRTVLKIALRIGIALAAIVIASVVLTGIFSDLDITQIRGALQTLSDAEWIALASGWVIWIGAQGLQTASLVTAMPARRGVLAYLGPSAVASVIPGPSDLPVRFSMYQSWGIPTEEAATAVAASGIFSVGSQLALPAFAGLAIFFGSVNVEGFAAIIVVATLVLAVAIVLAAFLLGSERRTRWAGERLDPMWRGVRRLARKGSSEQDLGTQLEDRRRALLEYLHDKWLETTGATLLTVAAKCSLLIMSLRFVGIPESVLSWAAIFAVFALVAGITVVPITPGSAGVAEIALVGMLTPIAGSSYVNEVAAGVLLYRLLTWILVIVAGLVALGAWRVGQRRGADAAAASGTPG